MAGSEPRCGELRWGRDLSEAAQLPCWQGSCLPLKTAARNRKVGAQRASEPVTKATAVKPSVESTKLRLNTHTNTHTWLREGLRVRRGRGLGGGRCSYFLLSALRSVSQLVASSWCSGRDSTAPRSGSCTTSSNSSTASRPRPGVTWGQERSGRGHRISQVTIDTHIVLAWQLAVS